MKTRSQPCRIRAGQVGGTRGQRFGGGSELGVPEEQKEVAVLLIITSPLIMGVMSQLLSLIFRRKCGTIHLNSHRTVSRVLKATLKVWSKYLKQVRRTCFAESEKIPSALFTHF